MAAVGEVEMDYESDPEEAKRLLTMRRREASDDEEDEEEGEERERMPRRVNSRYGIGSDVESEGQGAPEVYDDDEESEIDDEEFNDVDEEEEAEVEERREGEREDVVAGEVVREVVGVMTRVDGEGARSDGDLGEIQGQEGKKENEPFAVPTAGAFYMHDDRFRNNAGGGRNRRMLGGRKLWESRDDRKWGHDKFEEMTSQERHHDEAKVKRYSRGRYRGRGRNRNADSVYLRGNKSRVYDNYNQNQGPKIVRGRGPRVYDTLNKNNSEAPPPRYKKRSSKGVNNPSHSASQRELVVSSEVDSASVSATKQAFASSLSSASPPFYPSGASSKETTTMQKKDVQSGNINLNSNSADADGSIPSSQPNMVMRDGNGVDSIAMDKLCINDSNSLNAGTPSTSLQLSSSGSPVVSTAQLLHPRALGKGVASTGQMIFQPVASQNQVVRASTPSQFQTMQRSPVQSGGQSSSQSSIQQSRQFRGTGSQTSAVLSVSPFEHGESDSPSESGKSKFALVGKGKGSVQGGGKGSFMFGGSQLLGVSGNTSSGHGDQNFAGTPTFLPVMPFGGRHPGGIGVPAVGMAFPGYYAQPNGLGNPEMTWLPVLAGTAGALGSAYGSPYIALDGAYHACPSGQTDSTGASSKESNANKSNTECKTSQGPEVASDEVGTRQKNTRRYTEMKFGQ